MKISALAEILGAHVCRVRHRESSILALMIIFQVKINVAMYIIQKWGQNLQKMGSGYEHFTQKLTLPP
jgi:hypothetical protein